MKTLAAAALLAALAFAAPARADVPDLSVSVQPLTLSLQLAATESVTKPVQETTLFGLPKNIGPADRVIRGVVAATLVGIGSYRLSNDMPNSGLSWAMIGVAAIPAATAATGYCPLYQLLGIDNTF